MLGLVCLFESNKFRTNIANIRGKLMRNGNGMDSVLLEANARLYAAADKNDPFAFNRAMTHIKNGIAEMRYWDEGSKSWKPALYEATDGGKNEFGHTIYRNVARP